MDGDSNVFSKAIPVWLLLNLTPWVIIYIGLDFPCYRRGLSPGDWFHRYFKMHRIYDPCRLKLSNLRVSVDGL
jgi:hypothetical protein